MRIVQSPCKWLKIIYLGCEDFIQGGRICAADISVDAKAETLLSKPLWRVPFHRRRCLIPADGFYEWKWLDEKTKQPYALALRSGEPFAFGGVWDAWKDPATEDWHQSFSIITTDPNELTATVHDRMASDPEAIRLRPMAGSS